MSRKTHHQSEHGDDDTRNESAQGEPDAGGAPAAEAPAGGKDPAALAAERDDLLARLQRVSADYLNYQKRVQKEIAEAREFANAELIKSLLVVLDDMERAMRAAEENHAEDDPLLAGMRLVYDKALDVLARYGLHPIEADGQPFDPTRHEAIMQEPSYLHETPTVLRQFQRGYELRGRVIRPARVAVSSPPELPAEQPRPEESSPWSENEED